MNYVPFHVCSASNEICSSYAQHTSNGDFEMGCDFPLCWACMKIGYSLAERGQKLVTRRLSMRENWLLDVWAYAKIGYLLARHAKKLFTRWLSICKTSFSAFSKFFFSSPCHSLTPMSPSSVRVSNVLCPLSHVFVLCLPSYVPCLTSLLLVFRPLYYISVLCLSSAVPSLAPLFLVSHPLSPVSQLCVVSRLLSCLTWSVPSLPSSFLRPLALSTVPVSPFLWLYSIVTVLCSSVYRPLFLRLLSSVPCFSYLQECEFLKIYMHTLVVGTFDGWLQAGAVSLAVD